MLESSKNEPPCDESNLKKMVILSEAQHKKTSKIILNKKAVKFKQNIEDEIRQTQNAIAA